ncbi:MAG TPA: AMP-binding protein, partial [Flavitalea sp.]|nr:AMP-binding protein [Flavitalea sp.]
MNGDKLKEGLLLFVHQYVHRQALLTPHQTAIRFKLEEITYAELYQKASQIAFYLDEFYSSENIIGICTSRDIDTIVSLCGILMSGKAYLPLDPNYPPGRLEQILKDSQTTVCLTSINNHENLARTNLRMVSAAQCYSANTEERIITPKTSLAYILYTSGSTGKPKGVSMGHSPLVNLLEWQFRESCAGAGTKTMQFAPLSFDVSFQEIFATLGTGGTLVLVEDDIRLDPFRLLEFIRNESINRIFLPFVALQQLAETAGT